VGTIKGEGDRKPISLEEVTRGRRAMERRALKRTEGVCHEKETARKET